MTAKSKAELMRAMREKRKKEGLKLYSFWLNQEDSKKVKEFASKL